MNKYSIATLALIVVTLTSLSFADDKKASTFKTTEISPGLTLLQAKGGNIALSNGDDGLLLIDDDYPKTSGALAAVLNKFGGVDTLKFIVNTHWHEDHVGGNTHFGKGVSIIAHDNVRKRLSSRQEIPLFKMVTDAKPAHALPNLTYPKSMVIHFNGETFTLEHFARGHTDGDTVVFLNNANAVHMGDLMFNTMFPFVDVASGGNAVAYASNVGHVIKKIDDNTVVIPGHGPLTNKKGLLAFHKMLTGTIDEVSTMKAAKLTPEQIQAKGLSKQWKSWGGGFIKEAVWISFIYDSL